MRYLLAILLVLCSVPASAATATLTWTDTISNEAGYNIERAPVACTATNPTFTQIGQVGVNVKTYVDSTAVDGNQYCYRVRAWNLKFANDPESAQYGTWSNTAGKDFPLAGPVGAVQLGVM